ncbi:MAG: hypothetical protein HOP13_05755 [Alphaproteobacteria bacterium]|nr:hypothetical protein [Alphaproteobacteria bacterium]
MNKYSHRLVAAGALFAAGTFAMAVPAVAQDRGESTFSVTLGNAVFGYSDGYYDNDRRWHNWRDDNERDWYRRNNGQTYHDMDRYDDRDQARRGWLDRKRSDWRSDRGEGDFSVSLGSVVFGYSDGYYDNDRRWHDWRDGERDWYRQNRRDTYYQMGRYDDRDQYRRGWLSGSRNDWRNDRRRGDFSVSLGGVVLGYYDGYYDNNRRWHRWRSNNERNWYRQNNRDSYFHMRRARDRDQYRRGWWQGRRQDWRVSGGGNDFSIVLANVVFGYSDGYYDNNRRWHGWRNDGERDWYRQNHGRTYYQMRRDGDNHRNRRDWREGRRDNWRDDDDRN